ncbi:hypothetical protein [Bradyrhizobium erythrophlei]|uniref:Uncharacterized protein n=1 Tax=Bradyrhizobium erythrophlei TaxID=1437360 RepID=A0A1M5SKT8_9BRAD|nr:hypothetical protein [Bradyrhizobium erythrophlei]SHH38503.1 hypothetical protein SAMN05443248_4627 [Bradyrhizobium erythrophlei]
MKHEAKAVLSGAGITADQDFGTLSSDQLAAVRTEAEAAYLRKHGEAMPADSASFIRKRYDLLQQRARA